ncbi:MAG: MBL fold metallo-hydrolase [Mogibacterium sp.]|nr:MBL fold metallo-hydrolase [Mogibacterium sp.]MBR4090495.1 MBL fold metallo-hydrolase [Mogibacterium sp.]
MRITFIGAAHEVTGSCSMLEVCGKNIIVDCGMEQGVDLFENIEIPVAPADIDAIVVTHAHIDHTGKLPFLVANGYSGPIYSTAATRELCDIMLKDSAHIQEAEVQWRNRKGKRAADEGEFVPLYTTEDVLRTMPLFKTAGYNTEVEIFDGVKISYTDAGHLLGSSNVLFTINEDGVERTLLFSGDLGNLDKPLIKSPEDPPHADYVVCESTYGDRTHPEAPDYVSQLTGIIQSTLDRGGNVVVPAFAVGRTQELLYYIRIIKEKGLVKRHDGFPVVVDSPLAVEATNIYSTEMYEYYDEEAIDLLRAGINPVTFPDLKVSVSSDESRAINEDTTPKIIISASGMCEAGRIRHHLKHNLWRPECTILFVGYQSPGTVGGKLLDGADSVKLFGEEIAVKAEILRIDSFSSHADEPHLREWVKKVNPAKRIFINHGEDKVTEKFADEVSVATGKPAVAPYSGEVWDLVADELVHRAPVVPVIRKTTYSDSDDHRAAANYSPAYRDLKKASDDLMKLINNSQGHANKELNKMRREIEAIVAKYGAQEG